jgi:hypothetical protein
MNHEDFIQQKPGFKQVKIKHFYDGEEFEVDAVLAFVPPKKEMINYITTKTRFSNNGNVNNNNFNQGNDYLTPKDKSNNILRYSHEEHFHSLKKTDSKSFLEDVICKNIVDGDDIYCYEFKHKMAQGKYESKFEAKSTKNS